MKKLIKTLFRWIFREELNEMKIEIGKVSRTKRHYEYLKNSHQTLYNQQQEVIKSLEDTVGDINVSVDVHKTPHSNSWAVISIQGKHNYIKFIDMGQSEVREIKSFLRQFERRNVTIDASPQTTHFLKTF